MRKDTFIFYLEWLRTMDDAQLNSSERMKLIDAIVTYADKNTTPTLPRLLTAIFSPIKATIDRDFEKYEAKVAAVRANGAKGGRPKRSEKPNETKENQVGYSWFSEKPNKTKTHVNVNVYDNVNEDVFVNGAQQCAPTGEEKGKLFEILFWRNVIDPHGELERFCTYNEQRKWKALDTSSKRLQAISEWKPADQKPRVRPEFLQMWHRLYLRLIAEGREDIAREMTDWKVRCECQGAEAKIRARSETLRRYLEVERPQEILDYIGSLKLTTASP